MTPRWFTGLDSAAQAINRAFAALASALAVGILVVVLVDVTLRALAEPTAWAYDVARHGLLYLFFLALGPALESGHHVAVDMFDRLLPGALRRFHKHMGAALALAFGMIFFWQLCRLTAQAFADDRLAQATIAIPLKWIYIAGPIGAAQFVVTSLVLLGRAQWPDASRSR